MYRREDTVDGKIILEETGCKGGIWIQLTEDVVQ
jgi:hypothetical protein